MQIDSCCWQHAQAHDAASTVAQHLRNSCMYACQCHPSSSLYAAYDVMSGSRAYPSKFAGVPHKSRAQKLLHPCFETLEHYKVLRCT
jgi:hypothetical protein